MKKHIRKLISVILLITTLLTFVPHYEAKAWGFCYMCREVVDEVCTICHCCEDCKGPICDNHGGACIECILIMTDDAHCPECEECLEDKSYCSICFQCEDCVDICEECVMCDYCASTESESHCPDCLESCQLVDTDLYFCEACGKCSNCVDFYVDESGDADVICGECREATECGECGTIIAYEGDIIVGVGAECGYHCVDCFEDLKCEYCDLCSECENLELCPSCYACEDCALENELHCPICGNCYDDISRCYEDGDHCSECCENEGYICIYCEECTVGNDIELCEYCGYCENCVDDEHHCTICGVCYDYAGRCEDDGTHCEDCCDYCPECYECILAKDQELCSECKLCQDCCESLQIYLGLDECPGEIDMEDQFLETHGLNGHHKVVITKSDTKYHTYHCVVKGCEYEYKEEHTDAPYTVEALATLSNGYKYSKICPVCKEKYFIYETDPLSGEFEKQPESGKVCEGKDYHFTFQVDFNDGPSTTEKYLGAFDCFLVKIEDGNTDLDYLKIVKEKSFYSYNKPGVVQWREELSGKTTEFVLVVFNGNGSKFIVSEPFTVEHVTSHVHDYSRYGYDSIIHWIECSICGEIQPYTYLTKENFLETGGYANQKHNLKKETHYTCVDSGWYEESCDICGYYKKASYPKDWKPADGHKYSFEYSPLKLKVDGEYQHGQLCELCGEPYDKEPHDMELYSIEKTCFQEKIKYKCSLCTAPEYFETEIVKYDSPKHIWMKYGPYNGYQANGQYHYYPCQGCDAINPEEHDWNSDLECKKCGYKCEFIDIGPCGCGHYGNELSVYVIPEIDEILKYCEMFEKGQCKIYWFYFGSDLTDNSNRIGEGETYKFSSSEKGKQVLAKVIFNDGAVFYSDCCMTILDPAYLKIDAVDGDCIGKGHIEFYRCLTCGKACDANGNVITDISSGYGDHTFDNDCDDTCNLCPFKRTPNHSFKSDYSYNGTEHYYECEKCGFKKNQHSHNFEDTVLAEAYCGIDGKLSRKCTTCGYSLVKTVPALKHKIVKVDETDSNCIVHGRKEYYTCESCGVLYSDAAGKQTIGIKDIEKELDSDNHVGGDSLKYNAEEHYMICKCGKEILREKHTLDKDKKCTKCGYKYHDNPKNKHATKDKTKKKSGIWPIIIASAAGAAVLSILIFLIIVFIKKKKKSEE